MCIISRLDSHLVVSDFILSHLVASRRDMCYNNNTINLDELMYDDYDLDYTYTNDYALDLEEYYAQDALDLDEDYARDGHDYQDLAYRHYA